ncbi:MAG: ROK family protein, partial [Gemmatimonadetes bacterium]|nr:ROK family protein [Gemmatimonadota bacterium]
MNWVLGIDIGGTNLVVGAVAIDGSRVVGNHSRPTDASRGPDAIVDDLVAMASHARDQLAREVPGAEVDGVGIGAPGPLDTKTGIIALTPNLGW